MLPSPCHECGNVIGYEDKFCKHCGARLLHAAAKPTGGEETDLISAPAPSAELHRPELHGMGDDPLDDRPVAADSGDKDSHKGDVASGTTTEDIAAKPKKRTT